jgi:hypothetical protein
MSLFRVRNNMKSDVLSVNPFPAFSMTMLLHIVPKCDTSLISDSEPRSAGRHKLLLEPKVGSLTS